MDESLNGEVLEAELEAAGVALERRHESPLVVERLSALPPAVQAAAVAATGFVAGVAAVAVVSQRRSILPVRRRGRRKSALGQVVSSNSFLVDVHVLKR